jgi:hypothetical protein
MKTLFCILLIAVAASASFAQDVPRLELSVGSSFFRDPGSFNRYEWLGSFSTNVNKGLGLKTEAGGNAWAIHSFLGGPQFSLRRRSRLQPWSHFLVGARRNYEFNFSSKTVPKAYFAMQPGGGTDISLDSRLGLRVGADYVRSLRGDRQRDGEGYRAQAGVVFRLR